MKAHYMKSKSEQRRMAYQVAKEEIEKQKTEICPACENRIGQQVTAMICKVLHDDFGFGKSRLQKVIGSTENLFSLCEMDGERFSAVQAVNWMRDAMGIDLEKERC